MLNVKMLNYNAYALNASFYCVSERAVFKNRTQELLILAILDSDNIFKMPFVYILRSYVMNGMLWMLLLNFIMYINIIATLNTYIVRGETQRRHIITK